MTININNGKIMTQKEKQLLLQDLCARLPYGVICHYNCVAEYDTMVLQKANCVNKLEGIIPFNGQIGYMVGGDKVNALSGDIKPYLRPMSSMTEEERIESLEFAWIDDYGRLASYNENIPKYINWLNKKMFDYRGLIPMGLALEAKEGIYKIE